MTKVIELGISTCPNDTFTFWPILERKVDLQGLEFRAELIDVEQLNQRLLDGQLDVAKASFHAALLLADQTVVLPTGSALGFGVGPLLLAARPDVQPGDLVPGSDGQLRPARVLCPGPLTTATLLYRLFHSGEGTIEHRVFSDIMPALERGEADFGVCIHEGRFTWRQQGLSLVEDLGQRWEQATGSPLPLGGILARRQLGDATIARVQAVLRDSLRYARQHRRQALPFMRRYAQQLSEEVIFAHVDLYVNRWTDNLGVEGAAALERLSQQARQAGIVPPGCPPLQVFQPPAV